MIEPKKLNWRKMDFLIYIILTLLALFILFKLAIFLFPFILAFLFSIIIRKIATIVNKKLKISWKHSLTISTILFFIILFGIVGFSLVKLIEEIYRLSMTLANSAANFSKEWNNLMTKGHDIINYLPKNFTDNLKEPLARVTSVISGKMLDLMTQFISLISSIPTMIIYTSITILATVYLVRDKASVIDFFNHQFPKAWMTKFLQIKKELFSVLFSYLKAQITLISLCFVELLIGFYIFSFLGLNVKYPLLYSMMICLVDALPVLGAGTILIPWALLSFLTGDITLGIALIVLYIIILIVRQILEPKLVSQNMGVHPLVTLVAMFSGFKLFGILGFLIGPILMIILKNVFAYELKVGFFRSAFDPPTKKNNDETKNKEEK